MTSYREPRIVYQVGMHAARGGAAIAMTRVHESLLSLETQTNYVSRLVGVRDSEELQSELREIKHVTRINRRLGRRIAAELGDVVSVPPFYRTGLARALNRSTADIVNLHWLGSGTLSIREIAEIDRPLVWRLPDLWAVGGGEH